MEDIVQTLIDLRLAHIISSNNENQNKPTESRCRRRRKSSRDGNTCDNNNNHLDSSSVITIDEDRLRSTINHSSMNNQSNKKNQYLFDSTCLRFITSRR